jgi:hypothetical protein
MTTDSRKSFRLGRPSDFELTNDVINSYKVIKERVMRELLKLSDQAEGLIIDQINDEMKSTGGKIIGRGILIGCGVASLFLLSNPIGAAVGITGTVIGYAIMGGSKIYEMRCKKKDAIKIANIYDKVTTELTDYTEAKEKVLKEMDMYDVFESGKEFKDNLELFREIMLRAERQANQDFTNIEEFLTKLKKSYNKLDGKEKAMLNSKSFLATMGTLLSGGQGQSQEKVEKVAKGVQVAVNVISDVSKAPWVEAIHGLNVIINSGFIIMDGISFYKLYNMKKAWHSGDKRKEELLENSKFEDQKKMKDLIREIHFGIVNDEF